jgi:hypothetical protein
MNLQGEPEYYIWSDHEISINDMKSCDTLQHSTKYHLNDLALVILQDLHEVDQDITWR